MKLSAYMYSIAFSSIGVVSSLHEQNFLGAFVAMLASAICLDLAEKRIHPMTDTQTMREAFETEYRPKKEFAWRNQDGSYKMTSLEHAWAIWQAAWTRKPADVERDSCKLRAEAAESKPDAEVTGAEVARTELLQMQNDEGKIGWYFDCDGHYIDVECDGGQYSIFFRDKATGVDAWLDQADDTHPAPEPVGAPADTARLDFMESASLGVTPLVSRRRVPTTMVSPIYREEFVVEGWITGITEDPVPTAREAIDRALAATLGSA